MFSSPGAPIRGARTACAHPSTHPSIRPAGCTPGGGPKLFPLLSNPISVPKGSGLGALPVPPSPRRAEHPTAPEGGKRPRDGSKAKPQLATGVAGDDGRISTDARIPTLWHGQTYARRRTLRSPGTAAVGNVGPLFKAAASTFLPKRDAKYIPPPPSPPSPPPNPRLALLEQKKTHS